MSELPDLPPAPHRRRPLPPGGLDAAVRDGRRRRTRFLGATGGLATAAVLVLALAAAAPTSNQSLQVADDPTPSAAPSESPASEHSPEAAPSPEAEPAPAGSPDAQPAPTRDPQEPAPAQPAPGENAPVPAPAPTERDPYTESPVDRPAPANCRQPPSGSAGPVFYGGGMACVSSSTSGGTVKRGGRVTGSIDICEPYGAGGARLGFDGGQEHEVTVMRGDGLVVYRFSDAVRYEQGAHERGLGDGRCLVWTGVWDTTLADGSLAPAGDYRVRVSVRPDSIDGTRTTPDQTGHVEFGVYVEE